MTVVARTARRLAQGRKGLWQDLVDRGTLGDLSAQLSRRTAQGRIVQVAKTRFEGVDAFHDAVVMLEQALVARSENLGQRPADGVECTQDGLPRRELVDQPIAVERTAYYKRCEGMSTRAPAGAMTRGSEATDV